MHTGCQSARRRVGGEGDRAEAAEHASIAQGTRFMRPTTYAERGGSRPCGYWEPMRRQSRVHSTKRRVDRRDGDRGDAKCSYVAVLARVWTVGSRVGRCRHGRFACRHTHLNIARRWAGRSDGSEEDAGLSRVCWIRFGRVVAAGCIVGGFGLGWRRYSKVGRHHGKRIGSWNRTRKSGCWHRSVSYLKSRQLGRIWKASRYDTGGSWYSRTCRVEIRWRERWHRWEYTRHAQGEESCGHSERRKDRAARARQVWLAITPHLHRGDRCLETCRKP